MATITITPRSNAILPFLKELLSNPTWVAQMSVNEDVDDFKRYNAETQATIKDAMEGKNITKCKDFDDYLKKVRANV